MKRTVVFSLIAGSIAVVGLGATVSFGATENTGCWDEYNLAGTRVYRVVVPKDVVPNDCTPAENCYFSYRASDGRKVRWMVPHGLRPADACADAPESTVPDTSTPPTTGRFATLAPGTQLPTDQECASRVRSMTENRPENAEANSTAGTGPNGRYPRVTGAFTGTTDEILQWTACKWGIDEDIVRAQISTESYWKQRALGDFSSDPGVCIPEHPIATYPPQFDGDAEHIGECPESGGLGQVRWQYHKEAFTNLDSIKSSAYNLDYTYAVWRSCFEGEMTWLNGEDRGGVYAANDADGCLGVWFTGRWRTADAETYIATVKRNLTDRVWEAPSFPPAVPDAGDPNAEPGNPQSPTTESSTTTTAPTTTTTTTAPTTTTTTTTAPTTTTTTTTMAPTTTAAPPGGGAFVETFDSASSLDNWTAMVTNGQDFFERPTSWLGDHDLSCGSPATSRTIRWPDTNNNMPDVRPAGEAMWWCSPGNPSNGHVMTAFQTKGYAHLDFTPNRTFDGVSRVCWDMNATNLGNRKWVQLAVVPAQVAASVAPRLDWTHPGFRESAGPASWGLGLSGGVFLYSSTQGNAETFTDGLPSGRSFDNDTSSADKSKRYTTCVVDNGNNTVTISQGRPDGSTSVNRLPGRFPNGEVKVVFQDVSYNPDKAESPPMVAGSTWHWDNIIIE